MESEIGLAQCTLSDNRQPLSFDQGPVLIKFSKDLQDELRKAATSLASEWEDTPVPVEYTLKPVFQPRPTVSRGGYNRRVLPLSEALLKVLASPANGPTYYLSAIPLSPSSANLTIPVSKIASLIGNYTIEPLLFIGGINSGTFLHYDLTHNVLISVIGEKEVQLVDPRQANGIEPYGAIHQCRRYAVLPRNNIGLAKLPEDTRKLVVRVGPGQALAIPAHWWHQVRNCGPVISVSLVIRRPWYQMLAWADLRCFAGHIVERSRRAIESMPTKFRASAGGTPV